MLTVYGGTWYYQVGSGGSGMVVIAFPVSSVVINTTATLCVSGNSVTPSLVGNFNNQGTITVASGINANAWNFFGYTVCCSGDTRLVQNLTVNGTTTSLTGGTYSALTVANTYVGYGVAPYKNYFQGQIDDFRYYGRVLCPMEMRVLYSYAYGKSVGASGIGGLVTKITPTLGTVSVVQTSTITAMISVPNSGTFSYLQLKRVGSNGTTYTTNISPSALNASGASYVYSDTGLTNLVTYIYTLTPYVLGTPGMSSTPFSVTMVSAPTAMTGLAASSFTATSGNWTGFTLAWSGGIGTGVTYSYYVNNVQVYPSGTTGNVVFTGLPTPSSSTTPTAYAWYVDICANNLGGTTHGTATFNTPPTVITGVSATSTIAGKINVSWSGGAGNGVSYTYSLSTGTVSSTSGTNPTTLTLSSTASISTIVTVVATSVSVSVNNTSNSVTTTSPVIITNAQVLPLTSAGTTGANTLILTGDSTTISDITGSYNFMNGIYTASASSNAPSSSSYRMFDGPGGIWHCTYSGAGGYPTTIYTQDPYNTAYQGGGTGLYWTTVVSSQTISGEWVQIKFPYAFLLTSYKIYTRSDIPGWSWKSFVLAGSTNGTTWTSVDSRSYTTTAPISGDTFNVTSPSVNYSYYRFIITSAWTTQTNVASCGELNLFGTY